MIRMAFRAINNRQRHLRIAGMPALLAAVVLTINCCHGGRYAFPLADASVANVGHSIQAMTDLPASSGHCHRAISTGRSGHHEGADERAPERSQASQPATPDHETCPGCNPVLAFQDAQSARPGVDRTDKQTGDYPGFSPALVRATHYTSIEHPSPIVLKPSAKHSHSLQRSGPTLLYVMNQSFLI